MISIVEIFSDVAARVANSTGMNINYQFGDDVYVRNQLEIMSKDALGKAKSKYPLLCLITPFDEDKTDARYYCTTNLNFVIAVNTLSGYTNKQRLDISFKKCLHPVYNSFINEIKKESRFDIDYDEVIKHTYSDNFSYGSRGVMASDGSKFELIDAIDIKNMEIKIKKEKCYGKRIF